MFSPQNDYYASSSNSLANFMQKIYLWMTSGLMITGLVAHGLYVNKTILMTILSFRWSMLLLFGGQLALVAALSFFIQRMSYGTALLAYFVYATSVGITFAPIFFIYRIESIGMVFGITAGMFAIMAMYGYATKADLSRFRSILFMGLMGIIIASLTNMYFQNSMADLIISYVGVIIFTALIAYDVQKIKWIYQGAMGNQELENKVSIICALTLYLDFINLFLMLLRILGNRRND